MDAMFSSNGIGNTWNVPHHLHCCILCFCVFEREKRLEKKDTRCFWSCMLLLSPCLYLCCINLRQQNPIHRAASLFHSCLTTYAHTQRERKWRCIAWGFWHLNIQNCVWGEHTVTERECCAPIEYSHLLDYWQWQKWVQGINMSVL